MSDEETHDDWDDETGEYADRLEYFDYDNLRLCGRCRKRLTTEDVCNACQAQEAIDKYG